MLLKNATFPDSAFDFCMEEIIPGMAMVTLAGKRCPNASRFGGTAILSTACLHVHQFSREQEHLIFEALGEVQRRARDDTSGLSVLFVGLVGGFRILV